MKFTFKELLDAIMDAELGKEKTVELLDRIYRTGTVAPGFYLRKDDGSEDLECWFRNVDENGQTDHGPTNYTPEQVIGVYEESQKKAGK